MKASRETKDAVEQGTARLRDAASAATDGLRTAADGLYDAAKVAGDELGEAGAAAARGAQDLWDQASDSIRKHPMAAFGIAFAAGVILTRLTRR